MTFEPAATSAGASTSASFTLRGTRHHLRLDPTAAELELPRRRVGVRMMEDIHRSPVIVEHELEELVVRRIRHGDGHQIPRSTAQQPDRDAFAVTRGQFRVRGFVVAAGVPTSDLRGRDRRSGVSAQACSAGRAQLSSGNGLNA
jgi:hypothetical protein